MKKYRSGQAAFIIENNSHARMCRIVSDQGTFCIISFSGEDAVALRKNRLYDSKREAENALRNHETLAATIAHNKNSI